MKVYEGPELMYIGRLTVQTLSSSGSKGTPANPGADDNDEDCNPAEPTPDCG